MKKQFLALSLVCSLSLIGMETFQPEISTKPALKAILAKKYIQKRPLTKQEQDYLSKTSKRAIAAGLAALGIAAAAVAGTIGYKYATRSWEQVAQNTFKKHNVSQDNPELLEQAITIAIVRPESRSSFYQQRPEFLRAFRQLRSINNFEKALQEIDQKIHQ